MEAKPTRESEFAKLLILVGVLAIVLLVVVSALYFLTFHGPLSPKSAEWNEFGGFLGGTVGPLFGLISLLVLLASLNVQRATLQEAKLQGVLAELQRLMSTTAGDIDTAMRQTSMSVWDSVATPTDRDIRASAIQRPNVREAMRLTDQHIESGLLRYEAVFALSESAEANEIFIGLLRLDQCLEEFAARGGDPVIGKLYGHDFAAAARVSALIGLLELHVTLDVNYTVAALGRLSVDYRLERLEEFANKFRTESVRRRELSGRII